MMTHNNERSIAGGAQAAFANATTRVGRIHILNGTRTLIFLILLIFASAGRAEQVIHITSTVGPPMTSADSNGIGDLLIREIFRRIGGYEVRMENHTVPRVLNTVNEGLTDGLSGRIEGLEKDYPNILQVPESIIDFEFVGFSKRPDIISLTDWHSLRSYNIAYPSSWVFFENHVRVAKSILKVRTYEQLFDLLQQDRVDIVLFEKLIGMYRLKQRAMADVKLVELPSDPVKLYMYFNKKHAALVPQVAAALRAMKRDGSYREIYNGALIHYLGDDAPLLK
jgi:polar amino acid transport system substrate-binding protein